MWAIQSGAAAIWHTIHSSVSNDGVLLSSPQFALQNTSNTNAMGADGYSWSQANPILIDQHEKLISMAQDNSGNHGFIFCNNPNSISPIWHDNGGIADEGALTRGSIALDTTNDVLHVLWSCTGATDGILYRRYTINRNGLNNITSISRDTGVNLQLDFQVSGAVEYNHPILLWMNDGGADGTYGKLLAIWSIAKSGTGSEIRSSMCVLGSTADRGKTAGNWEAPNTADTDGIGNSPQVAYSMLVSNVTGSTMYPSAVRKTANTHVGDVYLFYTNGAATDLWRWRRLAWKSANNNWSNGLTTETTISAIKRTGTDVGYNLKNQLGSHPVEDSATGRIYFGFSTWKDNIDGDTWSFVYLDNSDVLSSIVDVYVSGGAHSYAPTGDIAFDSTSGRLVVSYIKTSTQYMYIQVYDGVSVVQDETLAFDTQPVDLPLIGPTTRISTGVLPILFRDTQATHKGWYGSMLWPGGFRDTPSSGSSFPSDIVGLLVWYRAEDTLPGTDNVDITSWPDNSGNGNTATPTGTGAVRHNNVISIYPVITFSGNGIIFSSDLSVGTAHSIFIVFRPQSGWTDAVLIGGNGSPYRYAPYIDSTDMYYRVSNSESFVSVPHGGLSNDTTYLLEIVRSGTSVSFYKNGTQIGTTQTLGANTAMALHQISGLGGSSFPIISASIQEVFIFDSALDTTDREAMETYIQDKLGIF